MSNLVSLSNLQMAYVEMLKGMGRVEDEIELTIRMFRVYNRFCIRNGIAYVDTMSNEEFDKFSVFLSSRSFAVAAHDVKVLKSYLAFLQTTNRITAEQYRYRVDILDSVARTVSRSKYRTASDFIIKGMDMSGFFYVSPEHYVNDVTALSPGTNYNSSFVVLILAWCGLCTGDIAALTESQVSNDCSTIHMDNGDITVPLPMQKILQDYRISSTELSLSVLADVYEKVMDSSLFIKKRKSGPKTTNKKPKASNVMSEGAVRQRSKEFSTAISSYHKREISVSPRRMQIFSQLYDLNKQILVSGKSDIQYIDSMNISQDERSRLIRAWREREAFINAHEEVKPFLPQ